MLTAKNLQFAAFRDYGGGKGCVLSKSTTCLYNQTLATVPNGYGT